jgi:hypothetical protein
MLSRWQQAGLLAVTFTSMLLTAKLFSKSEAKHERQPKTDTPIGAKTETTLSPQAEPVRSPAPPITGPIPATAANPGD